MRGRITAPGELVLEFEADPAIQRAAFELSAYGWSEINYTPIMKRVLAKIQNNTLAHEAQERDRLQGEMLHD